MKHVTALDDYAARWTGPSVALRITLEVEGELAGMDPLHLDGLLAAGLVMRVTEGRGLPRSSEPYAIPLPLRVLGVAPDTGLPLWASTDLLPEGIILRGAATWTRYDIPSRLVRLTRGQPWAPPMGKGPDKAIAAAVPTTLASRYVADCEGQIDAIADLLTALGSHVGKKRAQGYGAVRRWHLRPIAQLALDDAAGQLRRPLPLWALRGGVPIDLLASAQVTGWTPPYYPGVRGTLDLCLPTGTPIDPAQLP